MSPLQEDHIPPYPHFPDHLNSCDFSSRFVQKEDQATESHISCSPEQVSPTLSIDTNAKEWPFLSPNETSTSYCPIDIVSSAPSRKPNHSYLKWLSNRQASRQSALSSRSYTPVSNESTASSAGHPYERPARTYPQPYSRRRSFGEFDSVRPYGSTPFPSDSVSGSPIASYQPYPSGKPKYHDLWPPQAPVTAKSPFPPTQRPAPMQRGHSMPNSSFPVIPKGIPSRAHTSATSNIPKSDSHHSISSNPVHLLQQLDLQSSGPLRKSPEADFDRNEMFRGTDQHLSAQHAGSDIYASVNPESRLGKHLSEENQPMSDSVELRNAYQAMTRSLQADSFDWAQSPNSNGSFSQHGEPSQSYPESRTHDLTMSWLQRGLPETSLNANWDEGTGFMDDNFDLLTEDDLMRSRSDQSPGHNDLTSSTNLASIAFEPGQRMGLGLRHEGQIIRLAETGEAFADQDFDRYNKQFEIEKLLGFGSYAVVYLVHEVVDAQLNGAFHDATGNYQDQDHNPYAVSLGKTPLADENHHLQHSARSSDAKPKQYALKCLSKQNLSPDQLDLQRIEAFIHQSIPRHSNIINLHCTYETSDWLFLIMEYCPGRDLYFWLEEADVKAAPRSASHPIMAPSAVGRPDGDASLLSTPWLLARSSRHLLLSERRLHFVADMFGQMCNAVQFCHDRGISHRDIKPENFIVQDLRDEESKRYTNQGAVIVKLTDFGLATMKERCDDFNCGSKPYMAYECRNNLASTYDPKQADVWSLGIVLLNLLFHRSPFKEPNTEYCASFSAFSYNPVLFLTEAFEGLTPDVAQFLCDHVFLDVTRSSAARISAGELGAWVQQLPDHLSESNQRSREKSSATSPLMLSRASSLNSMPSTTPSSPNIERQAMLNSWSQIQSDKLSHQGAHLSSFLVEQRRSSGGLPNAMVLSQPLAVSEERKSKQHTPPP
ncbi:hypothetical protein MYAM1_000347 [Malassezia yamatoensis]|uniref:Protein kinase domain-containing protein n=1 Tax=Malassezia yamatoensis TaxID=253288 RepID=A0AAJ5YR04_9BASI|nr:hypothetical protein MYAM1_000347 [Malassezia yamatoensis]